MKKTVLISFDGDVYFISGKSPVEIAKEMEGRKFLALPTGSLVATSSFKGIYTYEDYRALQEVADHHKRREWLGTDGYWHAPDGAQLEKADISKIVQKINHEIQQTDKPAIGAGAIRA